MRGVAAQLLTVFTGHDEVPNGVAKKNAGAIMTEYSKQEKEMMMPEPPDKDVRYSFIWYSAEEEPTKGLLEPAWQVSAKKWNETWGGSADPNKSIQWLKKVCYDKDWAKGADFEECPLDPVLANSIKEFPTLRLYYDGGEVDFEGDRTVERLINFVRHKVDPPEAHATSNPPYILAGERKHTNTQSEFARRKKSSPEERRVLDEVGELQRIAREEVAGLQTPHIMPHLVSKWSKDRDEAAVLLRHQDLYTTNGNLLGAELRTIRETSGLETSRPGLSSHHAKPSARIQPYMEQHDMGSLVGVAGALLMHSSRREIGRIRKCHQKYRRHLCRASHTATYSNFF